MHADNVTSAALPPYRSLFAIGRGDESFWLWNVATGERKATAMGCNGKVQCLVLPGSLSLMTGGEDGSVYHWKFSNNGAYLGLEFLE